MLALLLAASLAAPDVFLISVDTLRADRLGCYGYDKNTSPAIDRLANSGLVFEDCVCEVPLTCPSMGAMLTSRFPRLNGTTRNGLRLPDDIPTITQSFKEAGYQTFCVQSNWTLKAKLSGLDRGFDVYDDDFHKKRWGVIKAERHADEVTRIVLELLEKRDPDRPLFCWIHYSDPHAPYLFHRKFLPDGGRHSAKGRRERVSKGYDSEIAYTDSCIATLLERIPKDARILFIADHGESLYEHDYLGHGRRIYQTGLRIPLIIAGPGIEADRNSKPARGIDIGPTLLGLAGIEPPSTMMGVDLLNASIPASRPRVIETYGGAVPNLPGAKAVMASDPPQRRGVILNGWKLILNGNERELFHIADDPMETRNLAGQEEERATQLKALIEAWEERFPRGETVDTELSGDDLRALESLGYLE